MKYFAPIILIALLALASCGVQNEENSATGAQDTPPVSGAQDTFGAQDTPPVSGAQDTLDTNTDTMAAQDLTGSIVLDLNHPLAGETLNFEVELVSITKAEGNSEAETAESEDEVAVHYVGTLEDGSEFDNSRTRGETLSFTLGAGQMIPGFDSGVLGMTAGETKTLLLAPSEAYGERDDSQTETIPKSELESFVNAGFSLEVGEKLPTQFGELTIIEVIEE